MKMSNKSLLGAAIVAALMSSSVAAAEGWHPPLIVGKGGTAVVQQSSDRLIVKFREGSAAEASAAARESALARVAGAAGVNAKAGRRLAVGADVVTLDRQIDAAAMKSLLSAFRADPSVEYAEVDARMHPAYTPNDAFYPAQWHYFYAPGGLNLPTAWDLSQGSGIVVAVLDTGYTAHPDLDGNRLAGYDFITDTTMAGDGGGRDNDASDPGDFTTANQCYSGSEASNSSWHGTHVAGTIAAVTNNATGVAGVAPAAKFVPVRVLGRCGGWTSDISDGIVWAAGGTVGGVAANANPAEVINMSLGGGGSCSATYQAAINTAVGLGSVVVVAAGNSNSSVADFQPASCNNVITVASNDSDMVRSSFSNAGPLIDVSAPGGQNESGYGIGSTANDGTTVPGNPTYVYMQGTSMAAPHVAGVVALMQAEQMRTPAQVESILRRTTTPMLGANCPGTCGSGHVDATAAVTAAGTAIPKPPAVELRNGVAAALRAVNANVEQRFTLPTYSDVQNLVFTLAGGTGNADLYVRFNAKPTPANYDCRSIGGTNNESCVIPSPGLGTYHVLVKGPAAHSGAVLTGKFDTSFFTNRTDTHIPDAGVTVAPQIWVHGRAGNAPSTMKVTVRAYHTWWGDVTTLRLRAPDGTLYPLVGAAPSGNVLEQTFTINASSELANGLWRLQVQDTVGADVGHIDSVLIRM